jgi:hypothetical protein
LDGLSLRLTVGDVSIFAVEHPWKGVLLTFECIQPRRMAQFNVSCPAKCTMEQIAGLLYLNVVSNFRESGAAFKSHFERMGIPLFQ